MRPIEQRDLPMTAFPSRRFVILALGTNGIGDLGSKAAVLVTTVAAANLVDPNRFAAYVGLLAASLVAAALWDAGISTLVSVEGARDAPFDRLIRRVARARGPTLPIAVGTLAVGFLVFGRLAPIDPGLVLVVGASTVFAGSSLPLQAWLRSRLAYRSASGALVVGRWLTAGCVLVLAAGDANLGLVSLFAAQAIGELATFLVLVAAVMRRPRHHDAGWDGQAIRLRAALPFAANTVLSIAYNRLDIVLVAILTTAAQVAAYAPASRLQDATYLLPTAVSVVALSQLSRMDRTADTEQAAAFVRLLWRYALIVAIPVTLLLILAMPWIVSTLLSSAYESAIPAARILVPSMVIASIGSPILALLIAAGRGWATTRAFVAAFLVSVVLHVLLDPPFGAVGAAIASLTRDIANVGTAAWLARDLLMPGLKSARVEVGPEVKDSALEAGPWLP
jgi:O-antigen/teichoic acid export membrane protein